MRTVYATPGRALDIGRYPENDTVKVVFDVKCWRGQYPAGNIALLHQRPGDDGAQPVAGLTVGEDKAEWLVSNADVLTAGEGTATLILVNGEQVALSESWKTVIGEPVTEESDTPPEPIASYMTAVIEAVESYDAMTAEAEDGDQTSAHIDRTGDHPVLHIVIKNNGGGGGADIDDDHTRTDRTWSSKKISDELDTKADEEDLSSLSETIVNLSNTVSGKQNKLPITTPEAYGAKGDGVTDDTAAIQDAVDAGKYVLFDGSKTYKITETIELQSDMVLDFNGCAIVSTANESFVASSEFDITVYTGAYTANTVHSYSTGTGLISLQSDEQVHMGRDYYVGGMTCNSNNGHLNNSLPYDLEACVIKKQSVPLKNIIIRNLGSYSNNIYGNWSYTFLLDGVSDALVEHCNLTPNEQNYVGIGVHRCSNVTIRDCVIVMDDTNNDNTYGVEVHESSFTTVDSCRIHSEKWACITTGVGYTTLNTTVINSILSIVNEGHSGSAYGDHGNAMRTLISGCKITGGLSIADGSVTDCEIVKRKDSYDYVNIGYMAWIGTAYTPNFEFNNIRSNTKLFFSESLDTQGVGEDTTAQIGRVHIANIPGVGNIVTAQDSIPNHITSFDYDEICVENYKGRVNRMQAFKRVGATNCHFEAFEYNASAYDSMVSYNPEVNLSGCVMDYSIKNANIAIVVKAENTTFKVAPIAYEGNVLPYIVLLNNCEIQGTSESGNTVKAQKLWQMANCVFNCRSTPVAANTGIVKGTNLTTVTTGYAGAFASEIFKANNASKYYTKINPTDTAWAENTIS